MWVTGIKLWSWDLAASAFTNCAILPLCPFFLETESRSIAHAVLECSTPCLSLLSIGIAGLLTLLVCLKWWVNCWEHLLSSWDIHTVGGEGQGVCNLDQFVQGHSKRRRDRIWKQSLFLDNFIRAHRRHSDYSRPHTLFYGSPIPVSLPSSFLQFCFPEACLVCSVTHRV